MKKSILLILLIPALIISLPLGAKTQVSVSASASRVAIGDPVTLRFIVQTNTVHDTLQIDIAEDAKKWEVLNREELPQKDMDGFVIRESHITVAFFQIGNHTLGPFHIKLLRNGRVAEENASSTVSLSVESVLRESDTDIAPLKAPLPIPGNPGHLIPWLAGIALLILLAFLGRTLWKRRKQLPAPSGSPLLSPLEELEEGLRNLMKQGLFGRGLVREFCLRLTPIIKRFLNRNYGFNAEDLTSMETLALLSERDADPDLTGLMSLLLDLSDRVKFARFQPGPPGESKLEEAMNALVGIYRQREAIEKESHVSPAE